MNKVKVKICGIRTLEAALVAIHAGADFLGFNFVSGSRRYISLQHAKKILAQAQDDIRKKRVKIVGVFYDQPIREVNAIANTLHVDFVQLHGEEDSVYVQKVLTPVIKRVKESDEKVKLYQMPARHFLLDRDIRGEGKRVDIRCARQFAASLSLFLAGGLTSENVSQAVALVHPFAVDVASGIETNGQEDLQKIRKFITAAKEARL